MIYDMDTAVTQLLDKLDHPMRVQIDVLRQIILTTNIEENIKWNGPNYHVDGIDRLTMRLQPKNAFQLILHSGVKKQDTPIERSTIADHGLLDWKGKDRAILELGKPGLFDKTLPHLKQIINQWLLATTSN